MAPPAERRTVGYWYLAAVIDVLHMPLVIAMVVLGARWWSGPTYAAVVTVVVVFQVATLGCPIMALTGWLRQKHQPDYEAHWSFTYWLYQKYGRLVGVAVFLFFMLLALAVRVLFF